MIGIRQKLVLGFGGLLLIVVAIGVLTIRHIDALGGAIDVILRQNYRSVVACQKMTESLDRIDSGALFTFAGHYDDGMTTIHENEQNFRHALRVELGNIRKPCKSILFFLGIILLLNRLQIYRSLFPNASGDILLTCFRFLSKLSNSQLRFWR